MTETISPKANLYLKVMARLQDQVPELRYIDQDLKQLEHYNERPAVSFPCALIEIDDFDYSDKGSFNTQIGEGLVLIRVATAPFSTSSSLAPAVVRLKALEFYNIEQKVHVALHGWCDDGFSKLLRRKSKLEERNDNLRVCVIPYATSYDDDTTKPVYTKLPRPGAIINNNLIK